MPEDEEGQSPRGLDHPADPLIGNKQEGKGMPGTGNKDGMMRVRPWMRSDLLHQWIQSAGIMVASVWGIYTFVWQDILVPSWAPAHVNLEITLTPVEGRKYSEGGSEMTLRMTATNPSSRKVYALSNTWQLFGIKRKAVPELGFVSQGDEALRGQPLIYAERGISNESGPTLAVGRIFDDDIIHPGETINRSIMVRIPDGYEAAGVSIVVPALTKAPNAKLFNGRRLVWGLSEHEDLVPMLCKNTNGTSDTPSDHNSDCAYVSAIDLDQKLRDFDPLMRVFTDSEQIGIPVKSPESSKE